MMVSPDTKREQAAAWYAATAKREGGALAVTFNVYAERIRAGDADHRLDQLLAEQAEFDADLTAALTEAA